MNNLFNYITEKNFKFLTILVPFSLDLRIIYDGYMQIGTKANFERTIEQSMNVYKKASPEVSQMIEAMGPEYMDAIWQLVNKAAIIGALSFLSIHIFIYILASKGKKGGLSYIKFYALSSGILLILFNLSGLFTISGITYILHGILMLVLYKGMNYFKKQEE